MTGLIAIISDERNLPVTEAEISDLATAYESLRGRGKRHMASAGTHARIIKINAEEHSGVDTLDSSWAASVGVVHHQGSLANAPVDQLDGQFALITYCASTDEVVVVADPFGVQTLYLAERTGKTYISTSALALAKYLHANPSRFGLYVFLRAGYHFGTMTHWEGIERLEPGTCISFTATGRTRRIYWRPMVDEAVARLEFTQAVDYWLEVAIETCRRYLTDQPHSWVDLTGGYDSRLLSLILQRAGVDFSGCTRGDEHAADVQIAGRIAQLKGWDWAYFKIPQDWGQLLPDLIPLTLAWADGHLEVITLSQALWQHSQMARTHRSLISGGGGELLRNFAWQQEFLNVGKSNRVNFDNWIDMRLLHPMRTSVFAQDPTDDVRADFRSRMAAWAEPYASQLNTTQLDMMYAYKGTGHFGLYGPAFGAFVCQQLPFFFKSMFVAAISTDWRYRNHHRLMRHMIERLDPRIAAITTSWGGPAQPLRATNLHRFLPYYADVGRRAINKLSEKAFGRGLLAPPDVADSRIVAARRALLSYISSGGDCHTRHANMRSAPLFKKRELDELLSSAYAPNFRETGLLGRIITVELALRTTDSALEG